MEILFVERLAKSLLTLTVQKSDLRSDLRSDHQGYSHKAHDLLNTAQKNIESNQYSITALMSVQGLRPKLHPTALVSE